MNEFYARAGLPLPRIDLVPGSEVPEPFRSLLVHERDMTPTLEDHYGANTHLEILRRERSKGVYLREVVLRLDTNDLPVEFGANRIHLARFSPAVRRAILEERVPLGHLLKVHQVPHAGRPRAFFRIEPDDLILRSLHLPAPHTLYGRRNLIRNPAGEPLSEIVEILPPPQWAESDHDY